MEQLQTTPIRTQILHINITIAAVTILLTLIGTLYLTLNLNKDAMDQNLMNSAQMISRVPTVIRDLEAGAPTEQLWEFLDLSVKQIGDIDIIAVADVNDIQYYYPDRQFIGEPYAGKVQKRILNGEAAFTSDDTGLSGAERCAYAPVHSADGTLLGYVMVGIYLRNVTDGMVDATGPYLVIAIAVACLGILLSYQLSDRIKRSLMGYEPEAFLGLFHQREDILEALEEGVLAIDDSANIMYINQAAANMMGKSQEDVVGKALHDVDPDSTLDRLLVSKRPEHNVPLMLQPEERVLADRMPIWEDGHVIGAVAIWRNRTEVTKLAKDLTGVRHMVDAMRAYTHEFMNKLHVILGLVHLGKVEEAEAYILDVTSIQERAVGAIMKRIENPSVAALLVGKSSRCAERGIHLILGAGSHLQAGERILPADACVTILGNLIENSIDALNQSVPGIKEITVSLQEEEDSLLICVEDTGHGMEPEIVKNIFRWGYSTKSRARGAGLALVQEIVTAYQGQVRVESEPGVGTTFFVNFRRLGGKEHAGV